MACFFLVSVLPAQPSIQWQTTLGGSLYDEATSVTQTSDSGYIVAGNVLSTDGDVMGNNGLIDFLIIKISNSGNVQWKKNLGGSSVESSYAIRQTIDGGYIIAGFTESFDGDVSGNHGFRDAWVVKLSSIGNVEWERAYGGTGWEEAWCIEQTFDGGYIVAGRANSNDGDVTGNHAGSLDFWILKLNSIGNIEWQKSLGGSNEDTAHSVKQTSDGGYIIIGEANSNDGDVTGSNGDTDFWVVKLGSDGELVWQNSLGGTGLDVGTEIHEISNGYIASGFVGSNNTGDVTGQHGFFDCWVVKLDIEGELVWQKSFGGSNLDYGYSGIPTTNGGYVLAGSTGSDDGDVIGNNGGQDVWILKIDSFGEIEWQKTIGGSKAEIAYSIQQTSDLGFVVAGYASSNDGDVSGVHGYNDIWVVKLSPSSAPTTEAQSHPLKIYPNPAQHSIFLNLPIQDPILSVSISDLLGREVSRQQHSGMEAASVEMDIAALEKGFYWVRAVVGLGRVYCGKFWKG